MAQTGPPGQTFTGRVLAVDDSYLLVQSQDKFEEYIKGDVNVSVGTPEKVEHSFRATVLAVDGPYIALKADEFDAEKAFAPGSEYSFQITEAPDRRV